jgi:RNA recognition motif-containing protein
MSKKLFVGQLAYSTTDDELRQACEAFGEVVSVKIMVDRETGRSRGFGFVEMATPEGAQAAVAGLNGKHVGGRTVKVEIAQDRPRSDRPSHGRGFGRNDSHHSHRNDSDSREDSRW